MNSSALRLDSSLLPVSHRNFYVGKIRNGAHICASRSFPKPLECSQSSVASTSPAVATGQKPDSLDRVGSLSQVSGVLGCQWGDEGKGKLVDILAQHFDIVARCQV